LKRPPIDIPRGATVTCKSRKKFHFDHSYTVSFETFRDPTTATHFTAGLGWLGGVGDLKQKCYKSSPGGDGFSFSSRAELPTLRTKGSTARKNGGNVWQGGKNSPH